MHTYVTGADVRAVRERGGQIPETQQPVRRHERGADITYTSLSLSIYIYMYMYVCMCMYVYIYIYIYVITVIIQYYTILLYFILFHTIPFYSIML